ncbi:MAG: ATP-binding cassette domain-containing protein, partial [Steroidobacteraceae bacterium]
MARIDLQDVGHRYPGGGDSWALRPMTMTWKDGGAYALLGPSGCGKTTLLNIISGLIAPTRGKVLFDGRDVTALPPEARNIAQVFQFPVVYDTMTVFDNLAFPLRNRRWDSKRLRQRVEEVAEILELTADLGRRARALSADQKQKISL